MVMCPLVMVHRLTCLCLLIPPNNTVGCGYKPSISMPTYTKGCPYMDKENFNKKQKLLVAEQQEVAHHCKIKAQREWKCLQLCWLAEEGSENSDPKEDADDNHHIVMTKLSGVAKEGFTYSRNKVPKAPPASLDIEQRELMLLNNEESEEPYTTPCLSSNIMMEVEDMVMVIDKSHDNMAHTTKCCWESSKKDILDATVVKAQKVIEHDESPMPDHAVENALLVASWAWVHKVTGVNLAQTPQLAKLVTSHGSQVHGQLKMKLCPLVEAMFSFYSSQSKSAIKKNQALAEGLKEGMNFTFKHMAAKEDMQRGFLKAPLIQKIINTMWFVNKHDNGVMFHNHFKPFPYPALALVLMAVLFIVLAFEQVY
ncbi:hypothetical protein EDD17DRAFT_1503602 [Pisolithus thermaeus]|nr:hypothetical protein EDD17DRAFT_1503602 [Pisolithus thermaeus]